MISTESVESLAPPVGPGHPLAQWDQIYTHGSGIIMFVRFRVYTETLTERYPIELSVLRLWLAWQLMGPWHLQAQWWPNAYAWNKEYTVNMLAETLTDHNSFGRSALNLSMAWSLQDQNIHNHGKIKFKFICMKQELQLQCLSGYMCILQHRQNNIQLSDRCGC